MPRSAARGPTRVRRPLIDPRQPPHHLQERQNHVRTVPRRDRPRPGPPAPRDPEPGRRPCPRHRRAADRGPGDQRRRADLRDHRGRYDSADHRCPRRPRGRRGLRPRQSAARRRGVGRHQGCPSGSGVTWSNGTSRPPSTWRPTWRGRRPRARSTRTCRRWPSSALRSLRRRTGRTARRRPRSRRRARFRARHLRPRHRVPAHRVRNVGPPDGGGPPHPRTADSGDRRGSLDASGGNHSRRHRDGPGAQVARWAG